METTERVYRGRKTVDKLKWLIGALLFLAKTSSFGQAVAPISFQYNSPRNGRMVSASAFLGDFPLHSTSQIPGCYYAIGWYKFRVVRTGVIDSVTFGGDTYAELKPIVERNIRQSQPYWKCSDCEKTGGHWFTIPIVVAFTTDLECPPNPVYRQSVALWDSLFESQHSEQLSIGKNEWLLAPMYSMSMR